MRVSLLLFFISFCYPTDMIAQDYLIFQVKGDVMLSSKKLLTAGQRLPSNTKIILKENSALTVICPSYTPITLSNKGEYFFHDFDCSAKKVSVTTKYWKAVYEEFLHPYESITESNRKEFMQNVGSVTRGGANVLFNPFMTEINCYQQPVNLSWKIVGDSDSFFFVLFTGLSNSYVKYDTVVNTDYFSVSNFQKYLQEDKTYYWSLKTGSKEVGMRNKITILSSSSYDSLIQRIHNETALIQDEAERKRHSRDPVQNCIRDSARIDSQS